MVVIHDRTLAPDSPPVALQHQFQDPLPVQQYVKLFEKLNSELAMIKLDVKTLQEENVNLENANLQLLQEMVLNRDGHRAEIQKLSLIVDGLMQKQQNDGRKQQEKQQEQQQEVDGVREPQPSFSGEHNRRNMGGRVNMETNLIFQILTLFPKF